MLEWMISCCCLILALLMGTLITLGCAKTRMPAQPSKQRKAAQSKAKDDGSIISNKNVLDGGKDSSGTDNQDKKGKSSKSKTKVSSSKRRKKGSSQTTSQSHEQNPNKSETISLTPDAREGSKKAKRFIQNETPNMPQMPSSSVAADKEDKPEEGEEPAAPEPEAGDKKSEEKKTAKEPLPEEIPKKDEGENEAGANNEDAASGVSKKKKKKKHKKRSSNENESSSSPKKKKKKSKKKKKAEGEEADNKDKKESGSSKKKKKSKKHKKKKKHDKKGKVEEDEEKVEPPYEKPPPLPEGLLPPAPEPSKTKFENMPTVLKPGDAIPVPKSSHDPGIMTRLNNLLIDGDDPGGIPSAFKKVSDPQPQPQPAEEVKKEEVRQPSNARTNEVIGQKMAGQPDKKPSVTDFEPVKPPLETAPNAKQPPQDPEKPSEAGGGNKPKVIPREAKAEMIAKLGLKRRKDDYPTMNDVVSDWDSKDELAIGAPSGKEAADAEKQNQAEEMKLRKEEEAATDRHKKKGKVPSIKPEEALEKLKKDEEERVKKLRANHPTPKVQKRNSWEEKIAKGEVVRPKHDYPTFGDIKSDWETVDQSQKPGEEKKPAQPKK